MILTPTNDPYFYPTLYANVPPGSHVSPFYAVRSDTLTLENVDERELEEYIYSEELDTVEGYWESQENSENNEDLF